MDVALWLVVVVVVGAPGGFVLGALPEPSDAIERVVSGAALGVATLVLVTFLCAHVDLRLAAPVAVVVAACLLVVSFRRPRHAAACNPALALLVSGIVLAVFLTRLVPTLFHTYPPGWDPAFHLLLARKIREAHALVSDWRPFEEVALHYPLGSHALVAMLADVTRLDLHVVFKLLFPTLGALTTAQTFVFARRATRSDGVGLTAAVAYGAWALFGSIDYYRWGGLPNLLGMSLALEALCVFVGPWAARGSILRFALPLAAAVVVHHHVMLTIGFVLFATLAWVWRADRPRARWLLRALALAAVVASPHLVTYALQLGALGDTGVLTYDEEVFTLPRIVELLGPILVVASIVGALALRFSASARPLRPDGTVPIMAVTLVVLYLVFGHAWRYATRWMLGVEHVAFTPSRFVTDLAYVLPVYAGIGVEWLWLRFAARGGPAGSAWDGAPPRFEPRARATLAAVCAALGLAHLGAWRQLAEPTVPPPLLAAYAWIADHTPRDSIVLNGEPWAAYGTWRRVLQTPLPVSEPDVRGTAKHALVDALARGEVPEGSARVPVIGIRPEEMARRHGWRVMWTHPDGVAVVAFR